MWEKCLKSINILNNKTNMDRIQWLENNGYYKDGSINHTLSTKFLLPLVGITEMDIEKLHEKLLINVHFFINEEKIKIVVVLNDKFCDQSVSKFVDSQFLNENFESIVITNDYLLIYILPQHFKDDFDLFIEGKYSQTSEAYKSILVRTYRKTLDPTSFLPTIYECLYPTDEKRKLWAAHLDEDYTLFKEVYKAPKKMYEHFYTSDELETITVQ